MKNLLIKYKLNFEEYKNMYGFFVFYIAAYIHNKKKKYKDVNELIGLYYTFEDLIKLRNKRNPNQKINCFVKYLLIEDLFCKFPLIFQYQMILELGSFLFYSPLMSQNPKS